MNEIKKCQAKLGIPSLEHGMRVCHRRIEYLTAEQAQADGFTYSGWYHVDRTITSHHHAVTL